MKILTTALSCSPPCSPAVPRLPGRKTAAKRAEEVVYVDKPVAECTRNVRDVTQVSPCQVCTRFQVSVRADGGACAR